MKPYIYDVREEELRAWMQAQGQPAYRTKQVLEWLPKGILSEEDMTNLPLALRKSLADAYNFHGLCLERCLRSQIDDTTKYVFHLGDGNGVESVFMRYQTGTSVCLSTQSGCRMGCTFCASTGIGFGRNLTAGEMYAQVAVIGRDQGERISHVVLMGIGEPLENLEEVVSLLRRLNDPKGLNISMRHITLSTCGLVPQIYKLAEEKLPITLALSLHAPNDALRQRLMPIARFYPLKDVIDAVQHYSDVTGRRLTFEYALFRDVNDRPEEARELVRLLRGRLCHVNLIPANEFPGGLYRRSTPEATKQFQSILQKAGIPCTVRRELGGDIAAACGQLRRTREEQP